jgi:predicted porin
MPALALGFDSQGKGPYVDSTNRYTIKSPGFYLAGSKNYSFLGNLSVHGGLNLSLERGDGDKDPNFYVGVEKSIGKDISIYAEYDFANNDNNSRSLGKRKGYLNLAFRWSWGKGLVVGFDLKNVIKNQDHVIIGDRTLQLDFVGSF